MRFAGLILVFVTASVVSFGNHGDERLNRYLSLYSQTDGGAVKTEQFKEFLAQLERKEGRWEDQKRFLYFIFVKTHQAYLKEFDAKASFSQTLNLGKYNCLSGTALYALVLDYFGYEFSITETNHHIFLTVNTPDGPVLFEATDRLYGFVHRNKEVQAKLEKYKVSKPGEKAPRKVEYCYPFQLFDQVGLDEIVGLMHYNIAVEAYNKKDFAVVVERLRLTTERYASPRVEAFSKLTIATILNSDLAQEEKDHYVRQLQRIRRGNSLLLASR